jgi:exoribonuclease II
MSDFEGSVWATQDNDTLHLVCVHKRVKNKIHVLSERGREYSISEERLLWRFAAKAINPTDWLQVAAALHTQLNALRQEIDVALLWETIHELDAEAHISLNDLAELYFSTVTETEHIVALWLALAENRLYFKRRGREWDARTAAQIEELHTQRQREQERENLRQNATTWLALAARSEKIEVDAALLPLIDRLECWLRGDKDKDIDTWLSEPAENTKQKPRELVFDILQKIGRMSADADRDVIVAGLKPEFSSAINEVALALQPWMPNPTQTIIPLAFSIDDEDTREVDDALNIERDGDGWKISIAVSDPACVVHRGDSIDREAMRRGTTVYLPTQSVLMMPPNISCDMASLTAQHIRSALVIEVWLDEHGEIKNSTISRQAIQVKQRLHYEDADQLLASGTDRSADILRQLLHFAQCFKARRDSEGALSFNRAEYKIYVTEDDIKVKLIARDSPSRLLVAEMMILANHLAARYAHRHQVPIIYRTQEPPLEPISAEALRDPIAFAKLRKLMRPSVLSLQPGQHSGLGLSVYTQLTSPLRRFADLVMQRQLMAHINGEELPYDQEELFKVLATAEQTAREARGIEMSAKRRWFMLYLQRHFMGQTLNVLILDSVKGGYKVEMQPWGEDAFLGSSAKLTPGTLVNARIDRIRVHTGQARLSCV